MALTIMPLGDSITVGYRDTSDSDRQDQAAVRTEEPYPNGNYNSAKPDPNLGSWRTHLNDVFGEQIQFVGDFYNGPKVRTYAENIESAKAEYSRALDFWDPDISPIFPGEIAYFYAGYYSHIIEDYAHQGYPGIIAVELKDKIASEVFDQPEKPNIVLLMTGSNDLYSYGRTTGDDPKTDTKETYAGPLEEAKSRVGSVIDAIYSKSPASEIFVSTVPVPRDVPLGKDGRWPNDLDPDTEGDQNACVAGKKWNQGIRDAVDTHKKGADGVLGTGDDIAVYLVDMEAGLPANGWDGKPDTPDDFMSSLTADPTGLHPTDAGYRQIALFWESALIEQFAELDVGYKPAQTPSGNLTLSTELETYLPSVKENQPLVGFFGKDVGDGAGDGNDEKVAFSFRFPAYTSIESAKLILDLTPKNEFIRTDELLFADNNSAVGNASELYGNDQLKDLAENKSTPVSFDLLHIGSNHGPKDLSELLKDGDLNVVYSDDAIISGAKLVVRGTTDPLGSPSNDTISGEGEPDSIYAGAGEDSISGGSFADWLNGESGNDTLFGNANDDTLYGGTGNDSAFGGDGADVIVGGDNNDTLDGQNGNDSINGDLGDERYDGNDVINGGNGEDQVLAGGGSDTVYGGLDDDWLNGQWGSDWVSGDGGNDVLIGEDGSDTLYGGSGDDYFLAGKGGDYATGGPGNDTITFDDILQTSKLYGFDKIRGFDNPGPQAGDVIDLQFIDARPDLAGDQAFKLVPADKPQWGGIWVFDHSWDNSTMVQGWIGPTPYAPHGDWFQFWILDGPNVHARDYTAEDFVL